jgi:hypothetical protein
MMSDEPDDFDADYDEGLAGIEDASCSFRLQIIFAILTAQNPVLVL